MPRRKIVNPQQKLDEQLFKSFEQKKASYLDLSALKRLVVNDLCTTTQIIENQKIGSYTLEQIAQSLLYPDSSGEVLINASSYLYRTSPHYKRLCSMIANISAFDHVLDIAPIKPEKIDAEKIKAQYYEVAAFLEKMNLRHELSKIMKVISYQDVFYGVLCEDDKDFFIQQLPASLCRIQAIQDGVYNFKMNLSGIQPTKLNAYPSFIQEAYLEMKKGTANCAGWYMPPGDKQVCFKLNEDAFYPIPLFLSIVRDIFDLATYKDLKLQGARVDNYKAIVIKIPVDEKQVDKLMLTPEVIGVFSEMNRANMSDDIGLIHTPGEAEAISFKESANSRNNVEDSTNDIYDSSGVSKELFNGSSSGTALKFSVENDSSIIYSFYRQVETWFSRFFKLRKLNKPSYKFYLRFVDSTTLNRDDVIGRYQKLAQYGAPVRRDMMALLGYTPSRAIGADILESQVFDWHTSWKPLQSSNTQSGDGGRPVSDKVDDAGQQTRDNDSNAKR